MQVSGNILVTKVCRRTGRIVGYDRVKNAITGMARIVDLINDSVVTAHADSGSNLIAKSSGTPVMTLSSMAAGYPQAASGGNGLFVGGWEQETADVWTANTAHFECSDNSEIASASVSWSKPASENWYFEWEISFTGGDANFHDVGLDLLANLVCNQSSYHFNSSNWRIRVYNGDPDISGVLQTTITGPTVSQPSSTQLRGVWTEQLASNQWYWVRIDNTGGSGTLFYDDDMANRTQTADDDAEYTFTLSFT